MIFVFKGHAIHLRGGAARPDS